MQVVSTWMLDGRIWVSSFRYLSTEESSSRQARVLPPPSWLVSSIKDIWQLHDSLSFFSCPPSHFISPFLPAGAQLTSINNFRCVRLLHIWQSEEAKLLLRFAKGLLAFFSWSLWLTKRMSFCFLEKEGN